MTTTPSPSELRFDPVKHEYWIGKKRIPGLSEVLKKVGLTKSYEGVDPWYAARGKAVHRAIELDLQGDLDESSLDPILAPFLTAWRTFKKEKGYTPIECEKAYYSELEGYACTIDHYGIMQGVHTLIDVKCTKSHDRGADFQLCGQFYAMPLLKPVTQMGILELHEDKSYEFFPYEIDQTIMPAIMKLYRRKTGK